MARPQRCRRICRAPQYDSFGPEGCRNSESILLTLDEYEVLRLVDLEQKTHEQCAAQMDISRSTVTEIYESARRKLAACLVYGRRLVIAGGNYRFCGGREKAQCRQPCRHTKNQPLDDGCKQDSIEHATGGQTMKIAVTYDNGQIFQHFGRTEEFKIYDVTDGKITASEVVNTNGSGHSALAGFLMQNGSMCSFAAALEAAHRRRLPTRASSCTAA